MGPLPIVTVPAGEGGRGRREEGKERRGRGEEEERTSPVHEFYLTD